MSCALNPETWVDVWKFWKSDTLNEFSSQAYKLVELWDMNVLWHSLQACKFKQELSWEEENILKLRFSLLHVLQDMKSSWLDTLTHSHTDQDIYTILQKPSLHYASLHFLNTQWIVLNLSYCCMHYFNMLSNLDLPTSYSKFFFFLIYFRWREKSPSQISLLLLFIFFCQGIINYFPGLWWHIQWQTCTEFVLKKKQHHLNKVTV